ncbi:TetR/AcrR family transcriptional regulator [Marinilabilia salmonicolor]|uniref:TetR/AcrR family transcriptional regulator n=1 Tax=Marinilabilia salmonicolor TaxID=989 RepID=UPI000299DED1|nr:TetR/AcrR family transcriptional regulator [Marinilabilia salmonicolor]
MLSERQEQIISASIGLIDRLGIQGFTIKNLSKEIGISEPAIYRHFVSKVEILATILDGFRQRVSIYHEEKSAVQLPAQERIEQFFKMIFNVFADNPTLISVIFAEEIFRNEPALSQKVMEIQQINEKELSAIISEIALKEELKDTPVETLVMMFFGPVRLLARKWKMQDCRFDLRKEGDQLIQTIIKMISL